MEGLNSKTILEYLTLDNIEVDPNSDFYHIRETRGYFQILQMQKGNKYPLEFVAEDRFFLSILGEDKLYQMKKEKKTLALQEKTLFWAVVATIIGVLSIAINV